MPEPVASATVLIRPDTSKFGAELKREVKKAIKTAGVFDVPVTARQVGATRAVKQIAGETQKATAAIKTQNVALKENGTATKIAAQQKKLLTDFEAKQAITNQAIIRVKTQEVAATQAVTQAEANLVAARQADAAASKELAAAEATRAKGLIASAQANVAITQELVAARTVELAQAKELAVLDKLRADAQAAVAAATARTIAADSQKQAVQKRIRADTAAIAKLQASLTAEQAAGNVETANAAKQEILLAEARIRTGNATLAQIADERALAAARIEQAKAAEAAALKQSAAIQRTQKAQTAAALSGARASARAQEQLRRGALASTLQLGGVRGATLAASRSFLIGAAAIVSFAKSLQLFASFQTEIATFGAVTGATADELERVAATARQLGADVRLPGVSAGDAAEAMSQLARAGLSVEDSIAGARGVLQLATAAQVSVADATTIAASALNAFGLAGSEAAHVADVLANAANASQGSITDMAIAMQQANTIARQVGFTLEETSGFLTILARAGLRGSDAGTSLRTALTRLVNPTKKIQAELDKLGLHLRDANGEIRPEVFANLGAALQKMGKAQRDAALAILGGQDAMRALSILSRLTTKETLKVFAAQRKQGTAAELARARTQGLAGASGALKNTLEGIGIAIGQSVGPGLTHFVTELTAALQAMRNSKQVQETLSQSVTAVGDAFNVLGTVLTTVGPLLLNIAGAAQQVVGSIGVTEILAAAAAFLVFQKAALLARNAMLAFEGLQAARVVTGFVGAMGSAGVAATGFRAALSGAAAAAGAFALSTAGIGIAVAAAVAGIVFLATRETELERAQKQLTTSTENLGDALTDLASAAEAAADAQSDVTTKGLALQTDRLAAAVARATLQQSTAKKGSLERQQLENRLAVILNDVKLAEDALADSRKRAITTAEQEAVRRENAQAARRAEVLAINDIVEAQRKSVAIFAASNPALAAGLEKRALESVVEEIRKRADAARATGDVEKIELAKRLNAIANLKQRLGEISTPRATRLILQSADFEAGLRRVAQNLGITGKQGIDNFVRNIQSGKPNVTGFFNELFHDLDSFIVPAFGQMGANAGANFGAQLIAFVNSSVGQVLALIASVQAAVSGLGPAGVPQTFETRQQGAEIAGDTAAQIQIQTQRIRFWKSKLAQARTEEDISKAQQEILDAQGKIDSINSAQASASKSAASAASSAIDDADSAFLAQQEYLRSLKEFKILKATTTKQVRDDITAEKGLKALIKKQIEDAKKSIHDQQLLAQTLVTLRTALVQTGIKIKELQDQRKANEKAKKEAARQRRRDQRDRLIESIQLDIDFFHENENFQAEIKRRQDLIKVLRKAQAKTQAGTVEYRKWRNLIQEQQKAIDELHDAEKDKQRAGAALAFEFLQNQQGFAANLLSNIVPGLAISGTVGGTALTPPPAAPIARNLATTTKEKTAADIGPTRGGQASQTDLLRRILRELHSIRLGRSHPEASHQRRTGGAQASIL